MLLSSCRIVMYGRIVMDVGGTDELQVLDGNRRRRRTRRRNGGTFVGRGHGYRDRQREGHVLPVRPQSSAADENAQYQSDRGAVQGLGRQYLCRLSASGHATWRRAVRRSGLRRPRGDRPRTKTYRQEDQNGVPAL